MPGMKEAAGQHGFPHEHSPFAPLLTPPSSQQRSQSRLFHQFHLGGRAQNTIKEIFKWLSLKKKQQQWLSKENLLKFFKGIRGKQRQSSYQLQNSGSGEENHITSMPYMVLEKSAHYISLAFPPPHRIGLMTVEKYALDLVCLYWYCALRSEDEKIFANVVRQSWTWGLPVAF